MLYLFKKIARKVFVNIKEKFSKRKMSYINNKFKNLKYIKLHLGCGTLYKKGWINIDNNSDNNIEKLDINWDISKGIPFKSDSVDFIYHEHFIEHLSYHEGLSLMKDCFRVLKPGSVMRVACPDLDYLIEIYLKNNWREQEWVKKYNCEWIPSRCYMINISMNIYPWGHKYIYNKEDLLKQLKDAGFRKDNILEATFNESIYKELHNLETRSDSMIFDIQKTKIPCYVFAFFEFDNFKKVIEFLQKKKNMLDIKVIENHSKYSKMKFKPYIQNLINEGVISEYFLFEENISNNAFQKILSQLTEKSIDSNFIMITDGDIIVKNNPDWLEEEIDILNNSDDVFVTNVNLSLENLPLETFPESANWVPKHKKIFKNYVEGTTGIHLSLFRTDQFIKMNEYIENKKLNYIDVTFHEYCYKVLQKKWTRTKLSKGYHLTWDNYSDKNNDYFKFKTSKSHQDHWNHKKNSDYKLYNKFTK